MALETNCNLEQISGIYTNGLIWSYMDQIFDPDNWQVLFFHNWAGTILYLSVTAVDPQILKPLRDLATNLEGAACRQGLIHISNVRVSFNFQPITESDEVYLIDTFTNISNVKETIHNTKVNPVVVNDFLGNSDLRTYTKSQF